MSTTIIHAFPIEENRMISTSLSRLTLDNEPVSCSLRSEVYKYQDLNIRLQHHQTEESHVNLSVSHYRFIERVHDIPVAQSYTDYIATFPLKAEGKTAGYRSIDYTNMYPSIPSHSPSDILQCEIDPMVVESALSSMGTVDINRLFSGFKSPNLINQQSSQQQQQQQQIQSLKSGSTSINTAIQSSQLNKRKVKIQLNQNSASSDYQIASESTSDILLGMTLSIEARTLLRRHSPAQLSNRICMLNYQKFILFLQSKYQALKFFGCSRSPILGISTDLFQTVEELLKDTSMQTKILLPIQQRKFKAKESTPGSPSSSQNVRTRKRTKRRQVFHNLSKYTMHLILEILNESHLSSFGINSGFEKEVFETVRLLRESGKRSDLSLTFYYNHSHYNAIFLAITQSNRSHIENNHELRDLHDRIFGKIDYSSVKQVLHVNMIKKILSQIVSVQLQFILDQLNQRYVDMNELFSITSINSDCQAKVHYVMNVYKAIEQLQMGEILIRF